MNYTRFQSYLEGMVKTLIAHLCSAAALVGFTEFYIWSQGALDDSSRTKLLLVVCYFFLAAASECFANWSVGYSLRIDLAMNFVVAAVVSTWLTFSAFVFHPGLAKDHDFGVLSTLSTFLRFLLSIGLPTFLVRFVTGVVWKRYTSAR